MVTHLTWFLYLTHLQLKYDQLLLNQPIISLTGKPNWTSKKMADLKLKK